MANVYSTEGKVSGKTTLPRAFNTEYRPDLIQRAVVALQANRRQEYGTKEGAGMNSSADYFGSRRHTYRITINRAISRLPREKPGGGGLGRVRLVPQSVGGRAAHPPKNKDWSKKINAKEYLLALKSAISASARKDLAEKRGHLIGNVAELPLIIEDAIEKTSKTKDALKTLTSMGLGDDLERTSERKVRAGKGKMRGRRYRVKKSVLIVVNKDEGIRKAAGNIPGVDVSTLNELNVELLAPGAHPGRMTLWSKSAVENLDKTIDDFGKTL